MPGAPEERGRSLGTRSRAGAGSSSHPAGSTLRPHGLALPQRSARCPSPGDGGGKAPLLGEDGPRTPRRLHPSRAAPAHRAQRPGHRTAPRGLRAGQRRVSPARTAGIGRPRTRRPAARLASQRTQSAAEPQRSGAHRRQNRAAPRRHRIAPQRGSRQNAPGPAAARRAPHGCGARGGGGGGGCAHHFARLHGRSRRASPEPDRRGRAPLPAAPQLPRRRRGAGAGRGRSALPRGPAEEWGEGGGSALSPALNNKGRPRGRRAAEPPPLPPGAGSVSELGEWGRRGMSAGCPSARALPRGYGTGSSRAGESAAAGRRLCFSVEKRFSSSTWEAQKKPKQLRSHSSNSLKANPKQGEGKASQHRNAAGPAQKVPSPGEKMLRGAGRGG